MEYEMVVADPAGNITVFVLDPVDSPEERAALSKAILGDPLLKAEQAGFVIPPEREDGLWRLEMMGGEFCGNAARSFGLFVAARRGLKGKLAIPVSVSGTGRPVTVNVDVEAGWAEAEVPPPLALGVCCASRTESEKIADRAIANLCSIYPANSSHRTSGSRSPENRTEGPRLLDSLEGGLPVVVFDGITHVIAPDITPSEASFKRIRESLENRGFCGIYDAKIHKYNRLPAALGVLFYDPPSRFMTPAVYVRATDTLVFESSCGSGSAALGVWESRDLSNGERRLSAAQPGGVIEVKVRKNRGRVDAVSIGGAVTLSRLEAQQSPRIK
ncbi:MAG: hypothetical protein LBQ67_06070 [Treponema sp.]|jgi:diaminopimelate epimerase|nr:hypothetical protein [Treponema sp.]